ncbi:Nicotinamidase-related amidase [Psychrobacillus psychrotolerans]|uniref:Nicotinamidase-related amidase n=1 Tax=Psychrobacillus psychrotolerans TaxID=126156 RepID=A0A1I5ZGU9_9BACI|nr:isochorismatase family protein [Psychrobacillus psychrotolerans]SFQ55704.1 Nicotinamidase-related amidase [Psychrobacillus psychrotolerans]
MKQALLIIDAQQELIEGNDQEVSVFQKEKLIENINLVIKKATESDALIIFVRDTDVAEGKGEGFQVHSDINQPADSKTFDKAATNSFYRTGLKEYLDDHEIKHVVIMGCQTEHCIDTAVRTATVSQLDVTLVGDGHSTTGSSVLSAEQIINHHNKILHGHYNVDNFSMVRNAEEDLFQPQHDTHR